MRVAIASIESMPSTFTDDQVLVAELRDRGAEAEIEPWDRTGVDWRGFDTVVIRSPWDYSRRRDEFLAWCDSVGPGLQNPADVVRWNSDKAYLGDLAGDGLAVVETTYVAPGDRLPALDGEVVVKPTISAGARDTGRFGADRSDDALALVARRSRRRARRRWSSRSRHRSTIAARPPASSSAASSATRCESARFCARRGRPPAR